MKQYPSMALLDIKRIKQRKRHNQIVIATLVAVVVLITAFLTMVPRALTNEKAPNVQEDPFAALNVEYVSVVVETGDSLSLLVAPYSEHYPGEFLEYVRYVARHNGISNPNHINIGDEIVIPYYTPKIE